MLLSELPRVLLRRWYLVALGLVVTAGLCYAAGTLVPVRYNVSASVLLLPPASSIPEGSNPYLGLGGLAAPTEVLADAMSGRESLEEVGRAGGSGEISVERDYSSSAPIVLVNVEDVAASSASKTLSLVLSRVEPTLDALQDDAGVPQTAHIRSTVITVDAVGVTVRKPQIRALVVAFVGGLAFTLLGTALLDATMTRRSNRRAHHPAGAGDNTRGGLTAQVLSPSEPRRGRDRTASDRAERPPADADQDEARSLSRSRG